MKKLLVFTLVLLLSLSSSGVSVLASVQSSTGSLTGTVSSPDGVISGATVTVRDNQTGGERKFVTGDDGVFTAPLLQVGTYTVTVAATGFKTFSASDVKVDVGKTYSLNVTMEIGQVTETVTVNAGADIINATSAELSNTVTTRQIQELPLNGRNPLALVALQAGTSSNGAQTTVINGQQSSFTNITRDGINVQDNFIRSNAVDFIPDRPNVDDVGEFTIVTQNAGAELGYGSSQIQLVTPRGSNAFHGAAYIYNRNSKFAANDFFRNSAGRDDNGNPILDRPFLNRNQFGGRIGGPILKEKLFFFGSYEGFRLRQSTTNPVTRTILLPQAREGIFTYIDNAGQRRTLDVLQAAGLSADPTVASRILANVPTSGNFDGAGDGINTTGFRLSRKQNQDREAYTTRFDYELNQDNGISGTYSYRKEDLMRPDVDNGGYTDVPFGFQDAHTHFLALAYRQNFSSRFTNEVRGGFQTSNPAFGSSGENVEFFLGVPLISSPESTFRNQGRDTGIYNIQDNAFIAWGSHALKFGGQLQVFRVTSNNAAGNIPTYTLGVNVNTPQLAANQFPGGISTAQRNAANSLLALLAGIVTSGSQTFNITSIDSGFVDGATQIRKLHYEQMSLYAADQWRISPQLTLNYGLRYELFTALRNPERLALEPVIPAGSNVIDTILNPVGMTDFVGTNNGGSKFFNADKDNFAPIVSIAWSPSFRNRFLGAIFPDNGRTVLRGGYRMSYVNDEFVRGADNALIGNPGLTATSGALNPNTGTTALNARLGALPSIPVPVFTGGRTFEQNNLLSGRFGTVFAINPDIQTPRIHEYNISFEREIGFQTAVEIRYVGGRSDNLIRGVDLNQVDIRNNGFLEDFIRARNNLLRFGNPACPDTSTGCQRLTVFPNLGSGGLLNNATVRGLLSGGLAADLAITYITNNLAGTVPFLANPNAGAVDILDNLARYRYNSLQAEIRRRFASGFYFQANYTFQKTLSDAFDSGTGQTNFSGRLDNEAPELEYSRASYDTAHVFNLNTIYELPFGQSKRFLNSGGLMDRLVGGWTLTTIMRVSTGSPISIVDVDGTLNRAARAAGQTAFTNLTKDQIKGLIGVFKTPCGIFYINPSVINLNQSDCTGTGRAAEGLDGGTFDGQVFFDNSPGRTGNLERYFIDGPNFFNIDASVIKNIRLKEDMRIQLRAEAFNLFNRANFFLGQNQDINSTSFFQIGSTFGPRILQFVGRFEF